MTYSRRTWVLAASAAALSLTVRGRASAETEATIVGTVADFHGKYGLVVRDARGALIEVTLRRGTIISPRGLRLQRGMPVTVVGRASADTFSVTYIDTPYEAPAPPQARIDRPGYPSDRRDYGPGDQGRFGDFPGGGATPPRDPPEPRTPQQ